MRTNAPRMITIVLAVALTIVGLSATVIPIEAINDLVLETGYNLTENRELAWLALLASPVLLIIGSFFAGV
ncbi:MAG: hypothetical protein ACRDI1_08535 [Actinomycetota bacterium]